MNIIGAGCSNQNSDVINNSASPNSVSSTTSTLSANQVVSTTDRDKLFEIKKKSADTKLFYSDRLGVGFTYTSFSPDDHTHLPTDEVKAIEQGNKIYLDYIGRTDHNYSVEVFTKDPKLTLEEAISKQFLSGYSPKDCFVKSYSVTTSLHSAVMNFAPPTSTNYVSAGISFPMTTDPNYDGPWWENNKCPAHYSESNVIQYFMMNPAVPNKFVFVKDGNLSITSDGAGADWSNSIRIIK